MKRLQFLLGCQPQAPNMAAGVLSLVFLLKRAHRKPKGWVHSPFKAAPGALYVQAFKKLSLLAPKILKVCLGSATWDRVQRSLWKCQTGPLHRTPPGLSRCGTQSRQKGRTPWGTVQKQVPGEELRAACLSVVTRVAVSPGTAECSRKSPPGQGVSQMLSALRVLSRT